MSIAIYAKMDIMELFVNHVIHLVKVVVKPIFVLNVRKAILGAMEEFARSAQLHAKSVEMMEYA